MSEITEQTEQEQEVVQEPKKLTGLAAYHEKERQKKELKKGLNEQKREMNQVERSEYLHKTDGKETVTPTNFDEIDFGIDPQKEYKFETIEKSRNPRHQILGNTSKIFDQSQNRMRQIKYIPIADTIFVDEMGDRYDGYPDTPLAFHNNELIVEGSDTRLVEFMLSHDQYDGNKQRISKFPPMFTLVNKADLERRIEAEYTDKVKAMNAINETDFKDLLPIARVIFNIVESDPITVRNKMRSRVERDCKKILNNLDSPKVKRSYILQLALDQGIIEIINDKRSLNWGETKTLLKEMKAYREPEAIINEICDWSFTNEGSRAYDVIKAKISLKM